MGEPTVEDKARIEPSAEESATFLREEMGHAKSVILDSDKSLHQRAEMVRRMGVGR